MKKMISTIDAVRSKYRQLEEILRINPVEVGHNLLRLDQKNSPEPTLPDASIQPSMQGTILESTIGTGIEGDAS